MYASCHIYPTRSAAGESNLAGPDSAKFSHLKKGKKCNPVWRKKRGIEGKREHNEKDIEQKRYVHEDTSENEGKNQREVTCVGMEMRE